MDITPHGNPVNRWLEILRSKVERHARVIEVSLDYCDITTECFGTIKGPSVPGGHDLISWRIDWRQGTVTYRPPAELVEEARLEALAIANSAGYLLDEDRVNRLTFKLHL